MGMAESGTQEINSNTLEESNHLEYVVGNSNCKDPAPDKDEMDLVTVPVEQKEPQNTEASVVVEETGANPRDNSDVGAEKREAILENVNISVAVDAKLEPMQKDSATDPGQLENNDKGSSAQPRKRNENLKTPVSSAWALRSRSQEKPKAPAPSESVKEVDGNEEKKKSRRKKKQMKKNTNTANEFSRARSHLRYLLHRIKYEQSLIDAYSAEGWRKQSVDKLKPEKELERAKSHILRYKLKIRALFEQLDTSLSVGKLSSLFDAEGEIDSEDIFCAKCGSKDLHLDNDIILCDGACERGFHQFCLNPPLLKEEIPPGDEGWLCPGCDCKVDCIDILKDFQGTKITILDSWEKIFPEAAAAASGKTLDDGSGSLSDDSEDDDYDPDKADTVQSVEGDESGDESSSDESNYFSADEDVKATVHNENEQYLGLPSDDSEDDDFDPAAPDDDKPVKEDSSDFTSDSEDLGALLGDATLTDQDPEHISPLMDHKEHSTLSKEENSKAGRKTRSSLKDELSYLTETCAEPVLGKRHVERLDYQKLLEETYGNASSDSSDEDFDDITAPKKRKINRKKIEADSPKTPITKSETNTKDEVQKETNHLPKRTEENVADGSTSKSPAEVGSTSTGTKKSSNRRLGEAATQRLYQSFNENQYPEKAARENLAKEIGLTFQQVSKWFENSRWSFNHRPQMESKLKKTPPVPQPTIETNTTLPNQSVQPLESSPIVAQNQISEMRVENLVTKTSEENSATRTSRKRKGKMDQPSNDITVTNESKRQTRSRKSVA